MRVIEKNTENIQITMEQAQEGIVKEFKSLGSWMDKYKYVVELGKSLPPMDSNYRTEDNLIRGCQMKTWFCSRLENGRVFYSVDSMSLIIKGISVLLIRVLSGQSPEDIKNADMGFIDKIGLKEEFSPIRENSLWKLVNRIKSDADSYCNNK